MLRVHVLCAGARYGNGERTFYDHFQQAWIQNPVPLPIVGKGDNLIPSIHIVDLARLVRRVVIEAPKVHPYIFAIDRTKRPTQKRIVSQISKCMGTDKTENVLPLELNPPVWQYRMLTNLKMKASDAFKDGTLTEAEEEKFEDEDEKEAELAKRKFPWHCEKGIIGNMPKLNEEFNNYRGLNPVKIFVTGPPASGKSFYSAQLAKYYNIPHVSVKQLADEALRISKLEEEAIGENEFWLNIKTKCDEKRAEEAERQNAKNEGLPPPEGQDEWPVIEPTDIDWVRVPDDIIYELLRRELVKNACRNRGYILDGLPKTFYDAQNCFLMKRPKENEEDEEEEEEEPEEGQKKTFGDSYIVNQAIVPKSVIQLTGNDEDLIKRVKHLPEEKISGTHYNPEDM